METEIWRKKNTKKNKIPFFRRLIIYIADHIDYINPMSAKSLLFFLLGKI